MALKIDVAKAFDTLSWKFLMHTLNFFGFNDKFCQCIHVILNSANMSINFNGKHISYFSCSNGLRQGGPLSPLLFCIAGDVLSIGITNLVNSNSINQIKANKNCLVPSHTFFADDIIIFYRGDIKSLTTIAELLKEYGDCYSQLCNSIKSLIYAGGMSNARHINWLTL